MAGANSGGIGVVMAGAAMAGAGMLNNFSAVHNLTGGIASGHLMGGGGVLMAIGGAYMAMGFARHLSITDNSK